MGGNIKRSFSLILFIATSILRNPYCCFHLILYSNKIRSVEVNAFTIDSISSHSNQNSRHYYHFPASTSLLLSSKPDDDGFDIEDENLEKSKISTGLNLGFLKPLTSDDAEELKAEASSKVNEAFEIRRQELLDLKSSVAKDYETSKVNMKYESELRAEAEAKKLMDGMDTLCDDFLEETKFSREGTKMAARADGAMEGKGLELGSWGSVGGLDVLTDSSGSGVGGFLGSVGAAGVRKRTGEARKMEEDGEEEEEMESKILVIFDGNKDAKMQKVLDRFTTLLSTPLPSTTTTTYLPTSVLPMGGNGAQTIIIVSSSLSNGRLSAESILSRVLKRSLPRAGARITPPPSHLVVLSSLGTERTDKFPYSMQNMMGGKLSKMYDVEEVVISTVKGRMVAEGGGGAGDVPLDYTVIKLGEIVDDSKVKKKGKGDGVGDDGVVTIRPGDSLDGTVGVEAAANVLLQAVAMQPNARNATMSVIGGMVNDSDDDIWGDAFLRLDGPELWRMEEKDIINSNNKDEVDRAFDTLTTYLEEWSLIFDNGAKGTGLTTPVTLTQPILSVVQDEGNSSSSIRVKWSLRLEFKATSTGAAYKSKSEERQLERERSTPSTTSSKKEPVVMKNVIQKKEGGIEILAEKTMGKNGIMGIRIRARRCNMNDFTVVKEISEEVIVKKVQEAVAVWKKQSKQ